LRIRESCGFSQFVSAHPGNDSTEMAQQISSK
jgi:hypothetical protein